MKRILLLVLLGVIIPGAPTGCSKAKKSGPAPSLADTAAANSAADPVEIGIKWLPGKKYYWRMENIQSWEAEGSSGAPGKVTMGLSHEYTISVGKELPGGGHELELEFIAQKMFYQMGQIPLLNFDSGQAAAQDAGNPVAPVLRRLLGARLLLLTDSRGRVTRIQGFDQMRALLSGARPEVRAMIDGMFNEINLGQVCNFAAALQPDDAIKIGDTWTVHTEMPDPVGLMVVDLKCALKDWEPQNDLPCVRVEFLGDVSSKASATNPAAGTRIDGGTISGKAWFDPQLRMLANSATEQHVNLSTTARGKTITTRFNLTVNFRLIKAIDIGK